MHVFQIKLLNKSINNVLILQRSDIMVKQMMIIVKFLLKRYTKEYMRKKNHFLNFLKKQNIKSP